MTAARAARLPIVLEPRGDNLGVLTAATRGAAEIAAIGGYVAQVWTWRGREAVVVREWSGLHGYERWVVIVRRGLRRGVPQRLQVGSIAGAMSCLGIAYRMKSVRRPPTLPDPMSTAGRRRRLLPAIRARGNRWRTLRARIRVPRPDPRGRRDRAIAA